MYRAISREVSVRGLDLSVIRNSSRGMFWLEPLVEVETPRGRIAYGCGLPSKNPAWNNPGTASDDTGPHCASL
jgi:hypothetical protein